VSVASGATLDFASVDMSLSRLAVDMDAGAGTITRFTPSAGGTIDLSTSSPIAGDVIVPLTISSVTSPENFKSWTVKVNGVVRGDLRICWRAGSLYCGKTPGFMVIFR